MRVLKPHLKWFILPAIALLHVGTGGRLLDCAFYPTPYFTFEIDLTRDLTIGLAIGLVYVGISRWLVHSTRWGKALEDELLGLLRNRERSPLSDAISSSILEECVFRGLLLNYVSLWLGAAIFALFHLPTQRDLILWMLSAFAMGLVFGVLFLSGFSLLAPLSAHFIINYLNLHYLNRRQPAL